MVLKMSTLLGWTKKVWHGQKMKRRKPIIAFFYVLFVYKTLLGIENTLCLLEELGYENEGTNHHNCIAF